MICGGAEYENCLFETRAISTHHLFIHSLSCTSNTSTTAVSHTNSFSPCTSAPIHTLEGTDSVGVRMQLLSLTDSMLGIRVYTHRMFSII